jgi:16S rRNA (guanine527-N7)-methyltransferase
MTDMNDCWANLSSGAGMRLSAKQRQLLMTYLDLLLEANQTMNLTRLTDRAEAETLNVGDALTLLPFLPAGAIEIADVGSGGGTPGIPLAIVREEAKVTCIEATRKKAAFLKETAAKLELKNLQVVAGRAEEVAQDRLRHRFDVVVARALGKMVWVAEWCLPLAKTGGKVLAMKGSKAQEELAEARRVIARLGGAAVVVHPVALPGADQHVVVEIRKVKLTDKRFPRLPSHAKGSPLR